MLFTPTVVKNLLRKPATRNYPFDVREGFPMYRGELVIDINKCIFCGMCSRKCPSQCITVNKKEATWQCDPHACVYCGYCRDACPTKCLSMKDVHRAPLTEKTTWIEQGTPKAKKKVTPKVKAPATEEDLSPKSASHKKGSEKSEVQSDKKSSKASKKNA